MRGRRGQGGKVSRSLAGLLLVASALAPGCTRPGMETAHPAAPALPATAAAAAAPPEVAPVPEATESEILIGARALFTPGPPPTPHEERATPAAVSLGQALFFDPSLSVNGSRSCNSCHPLDRKRPGADNQILSTGATGKSSLKHTPTLLNASQQRAMGWEGRAADPAAFAGEALLDPLRMGLAHPKVAVKRLSESNLYRWAFREAYPGQRESLTYENLLAALAAYMDSLRTRDRFDSFLAGQEDLLSTEEKSGLTLFMDAGCAGCHDGPLLGGRSLAKPDSTAREDASPAPTKVPLLLNVAMTAPYFHDGQTATLGEAISFMARQNGATELSDGEIRSLLLFMTALSDLDRISAPPVRASSFKPPPRRGWPDTGAGIYRQYCLSCHGPEGKGFRGAGEGWIVPPVDLQASSVKNIRTSMPPGSSPEQPFLTVEQAHDLSAYLSSLGQSVGERNDAVAAAETTSP